MSRSDDAPFSTRRRVNVRSLLTRHWFLLGLLAVIPIGLWLGMSALSDGIAAVTNRLSGSWLTAIVLFLMSLTLDSRRLLASMRSPRAVLGAAFVSQLLIPLMALPLLPLVSSEDLRLGLLIAASVPCTMAAASVWTRMAGGNDAVSLLVTLLTNAGSFVVAPAWLALAASGEQMLRVSAELSFGRMMQKLVVAAVLPSIAGQLLRLVPTVGEVVERRRRSLSNSAQAIILFLVYVSALRGGIQVSQNQTTPGALTFVLVWLFCMGLHLAAVGLSHATGKLLRVSDGDRIAMLFAGSQKTLPVGLLIAQASGVPLAILPMLMFHASQLFIDTAIATRVRRPD